VSHGTIAALFAAAAVVALALLVPVCRNAFAAHDLDTSAVLAFATATFFSLSSVVVAVTGQLQRIPDAFGDLTTIDPSWFHRVDQASILLLVAVIGLTLWRQVSAGPLTVHAAGVIAIALWAIANLSAGLQGGRLVTARGVVLLLCLVAATILPRGRGAAFGVGVFGVLLAAAGGILSLFRYDVAFVVPCHGACSPPGFTGVLPNENLLGIALTASIPFAYLGFRGRSRVWLCVYLAAMAAATGSRTAAGGAFISLAALLIVRPRLDAVRRASARALVAWAVLAGAVTSSVYVVRHHWSPTALTTRPELWGVAWHYIRRSPWFGYGPEKWASLYSQFSEIPVAAQRTTHNQWTDLLFVSGGIGAALFVTMVAAAILTAGHARSGVVLIIATILMIGTTEGAWTIGTLDLLSFSLVAFILTGEVRVVQSRAAARARSPATRTAPRPRRLAHGTVPEL
jgi:hypothetical protein